MTRTALITDSTCDIPQEMLDQYGIIIAPQFLIWGTQQYRDRIDISAEEFYTRLPVDPVAPTTSMPVARDFLALIEQVRQAGAEEVVIITISSQLSSTQDSARQAAETAPIPVYPLDSFSGGMGLGWQVLAAARAREAGGDAQAMLAAAQKVRQTLRYIFFVDSLEYLHRGGRIGGAAKLIGSALNLKPVLYVDHQAGRVEPGERVRTRSRALERVHQTFFEQMDTGRPLHIAVTHSNVPDLAQALAERIEQEVHPAEMILTPISPVMGTHIGPGAVGLAGYYET